MHLDETIKTFAMVAGGIGLGQLLLFWVTRRAKKADLRSEQELNLGGTFLAERRELLTSLRAQLMAEQSARVRAEGEKLTLMQQVFALQQACNEVVAKYDFLRGLNPDAGLPPITVHLPANPPASQASATEVPMSPEGGNDHA